MASEHRDVLKALVRAEIEAALPTLIGLSDWMYHNPELGRQEFQASNKIVEIIQEYGERVNY